MEAVAGVSDSHEQRSALYVLLCVAKGTVLICSCPRSAASCPLVGLAENKLLHSSLPNNGGTGTTHHLPARAIHSVIQIVAGTKPFSRLYAKKSSGLFSQRQVYFEEHRYVHVGILSYIYITGHSMDAVNSVCRTM